MAQARTSKTNAVSADIRVIDELPPDQLQNGVRVRALAAKGHETDARPVGGFFIRRRYAGEEFVIPRWELFSPNWMEFVEEPPAKWKEMIELRAQQKLDLEAKAAAEPPAPSANDLMFAMSQVLARAVGRTPQEFNFSDGTMKKPGTDDKVI